MKLYGRKIGILIAPRGTEEPEFAKPKAAVEEAGGTVTVISLGTDDAQSVNNDLDPGATFPVDKAVGDVSASDFDALIIPGGSVGADKLRGSTDVVAFVRDFSTAGKPVATDIPTRLMLPSFGRSVILRRKGGCGDIALSVAMFTPALR